MHTTAGKKGGAKLPIQPGEDPTQLDGLLAGVVDVATGGDQQDAQRIAPVFMSSATTASEVGWLTSV